MAVLTNKTNLLNGDALDAKIINDTTETALQAITVSNSVRNDTTTFKVQLTAQQNKFESDVNSEVENFENKINSDFRTQKDEINTRVTKLCATPKLIENGGEARVTLENGSFVMYNLKGDKGDSGQNAVVIDLMVNLFAMQVNNKGELVMLVNDSETPPNFRIKNGNLIYVIE